MVVGKKAGDKPKPKDKEASGRGVEKDRLGSELVVRVGGEVGWEQIVPRKGTIFGKAL